MTQRNMRLDDADYVGELASRIAKMINSIKFDWDKLQYDMWSACRGHEKQFDYIEYCDGAFKIWFSTNLDSTWEESWCEEFELKEYMWLGGLK